MKESATIDEARFDNVTRAFGRNQSRRGIAKTVLAGVGAAALARLGLAPVEAAKCRKLGRPCNQNRALCCGGTRCRGGICRCPGKQKACQQRCIPRAKCCTNADCGGGACQNGRCAGGGSCPAGQKPCQGGCIPQTECCGGCPAGLTCCANFGACKDVRNDHDVCGHCANSQCPGGAICANGDCGLTCNTVGATCFSGCTCGNREDPAHLGQNVCAGLGVFTCDTATACDTDASCSPATAGFRQVCVSGLCAGKNVCSDPCA